MSSYGLALPFDTDSPEFARGVEVGRLWEQLQSDAPVDQVIHASNAEMAMRLGEATGRLFVSVDLDETWISVSFDCPEAAA